VVLPMKEDVNKKGPQSNRLFGCFEGFFFLVGVRIYNIHGGITRWCLASKIN
jgi:hypothetical protein